MDDIRSDLLGDDHDGLLTPGYDRSEAACLAADDEAAVIDNAAQEEELDDDDDDDDGGYADRQGKAAPSARKKRAPSERKLRKITVDLPVTTLVHPRSVFDGFNPPAPLASEAVAIQSLLQADPSQEGDEFIEFQLEDFACYIYKSDQTIPFEMRGLHTHACTTGEQHFYFDGVLRVGNTRHYVHKVAFDTIPVGNYGKEHASVGDQLWIESTADRKICYQLQKPAQEYARYHMPFLWVADLTKHVVDFCEDLVGRGANVTLHLFKEKFAKWLRKTHKSDPVFLKWYRQRESDDFRQSIVANQAFIHKEAYGMFEKTFHRILLFRELKFEFYNRIGSVPGKAKPQHSVPHTIVTPYIYNVFSHMLGLDHLLKAVKPSFSTDQRINLSWPRSQSEHLRFTRGPLRDRDCRDMDRNKMISRIEPGDVISTLPDRDGKWKTSSPDKKWFLLVQKVHISKSNKRSFDVTWLYQPEDTPCCVATYPWANELFLSDHCTCVEGAKARTFEDHVLDVHSVEWFGTEKAKTEFFVRQTYVTSEDARRFVTLSKSHLRCNHNKAPTFEYTVGDTVLALPLGKGDRLEPFELLEYLNENKTVRLRRLRRRTEFNDDCMINELVYTEEETLLPAAKLMTRCIVRFYKPGQAIPAPYNRGGAGNAFIITHRLCVDGTLEPVETHNRPLLRQGFDPAQSIDKLRSLDLFCGGGNFGRGVEEGGAVTANWANDIKSVAVHTYMANVDHPEQCHPFLGSIDDLLQSALEGQFSEQVPRPGEVDVVLGGSPCQGFSLLTLKKGTEQQFKNRSLVAAFAACVDYWRPRWGILENVLQIVRNGNKYRDTEDYFSQLICALVGMGYQVLIILGDAWSHGSPQRRARAFLYFAAPGVELPKTPYPSHSHPSYVAMNKLGKMTNNEPYVQRTDRPTAFPFVSARDATADLPDIYDAQVNTCVPFPDHRLSVPMASGNRDGIHGGKGKSKRAQLLNIPIGPYGVNFSRAFYRRLPGLDHGDMFPHERDAYPLGEKERGKKASNSWGRAHPKELFSTVTTTCAPTDARVGGRYGHWEQPRHISIMEVRRAQGVPDNEVLLGTPGEQWGMVGNGVARGISMALGLSLREAWLGSLYEDGSPSQGQGGLVGVRTHVETDVWRQVEIPCMTTTHQARGAEWSAAQDDDEDFVLLSSRTVSQTPAASEPELGGTRSYSTTPATSLAETPSEDLQSTAAKSTNGKRPLSMVLATHGRVQSTSGNGSGKLPPYKRPRRAEEVPRLPASGAPEKGPLRQAAATRTEYPVYEENDDGELVLVGDSEPLEEEVEDWEWTLIEESNPPEKSASGLTVVRMPSIDPLAEYDV